MIETAGRRANHSPGKTDFQEIRHQAGYGTGSSSPHNIVEAKVCPESEGRWSDADSYTSKEYGSSQAIGHPGDQLVLLSTAISELN
jgi:hypothetical protein